MNKLTEEDMPKLFWGAFAIGIIILMVA